MGGSDCTCAKKGIARNPRLSASPCLKVSSKQVPKTLLTVAPLSLPSSPNLHSDSRAAAPSRDLIAFEVQKVSWSSEPTPSLLIPNPHLASTELLVYPLLVLRVPSRDGDVRDHTKPRKAG